MALIKATETDFGITASYWKITMISIDRHMREGSFSLSLYVNKDSKQFIKTETISLMLLNDTDVFIKCFESHDFNVYKACYEYAKANVEFFKDAVDDEEELLRNL